MQSFWDWLQQEKAVTVLAGIAGAAAMAVTDWRSPLRLMQHVFVGTCCSAVATPIFAPAISKVLGWLAVDPAAQGNSAAFLVGAFGVYLLELGVATYRHKMRGIQEGKDNA